MRQKIQMVHEGIRFNCDTCASIKEQVLDSSVSLELQYYIPAINWYCIIDSIAVRYDFCSIKCLKEWAEKHEH